MAAYGAGAATALAALGIVTGAGGAYLKGKTSSEKRRDLLDTTSDWLPDIPFFQDQHFADLDEFQPRSRRLARQISGDDLDTSLALREVATPGLSEGLARGGESIFSLMRGELPTSVLDAYSRAGGAGSVGRGIRGDMNFINQGLFGARGSLGAIEMGFGLLPSLLGAAPNINVMSSGSFLSNLMTPAQRTSIQMGVRGQNLGVASQAAQMKTSSDVWGEWLGGLGGMMTGAGMMGMGGGGMGGGGGGFSPSPYVTPQANPNWSFSLY